MKLLLTLLSSAFFAVSATAQITLMLDFGPTTATGADLTNSPAHAAGAIAGTETTWNKVGTTEPTADIPSGLLTSDGSAATGVSVNLGMETSNGSNSIDFTSQPTRSNALGSGINGGASGFFNSGIFANTSVGKDGIWGGNDLANGLRIDGLAAGNYAIYFVGFNTNENSAGAVMNLYAAAGATSDSFSFGSLTADTSGITNNTAWAEGANYALANVTISAGESLFLANDTTGLTNNRGFINSVQIVGTAIPEPSTYAALAGALALGLVAWRRRRN